MATRRPGLPDGGRSRPGVTRDTAAAPGGRRARPRPGLSPGRPGLTRRADSGRRRSGGARRPSATRNPTPPHTQARPSPSDPGAPGRIVSLTRSQVGAPCCCLTRMLDLEVGLGCGTGHCRAKGSPASGAGPPASESGNQFEGAGGGEAPGPFDGPPGHANWHAGGRRGRVSVCACVCVRARTRVLGDYHGGGPGGHSAAGGHGLGQGPSERAGEGGGTRRVR